MAELDLITPIDEVTVDGVAIPLSETNSLAKAIVSGSVTEIKASDLEGITTIANYAFYYSNLTSIEIPSSVTSIGSYAFSYSKLTSIEIPSGITTIKGYTFQYANKLKKVTLPEGLTTMEISSFASCTELLPPLTIPSTVTNMSRYVFSGCAKLTSVTILAKTPPTVIAAGTFASTIKTIYIPKGTLNAYKSATNWSTYADKYVELS